jgi:hypothetical protein
MYSSSDSGFGGPNSRMAGISFRICPLRASMDTPPGIFRKDFNKL